MDSHQVVGLAAGFGEPPLEEFVKRSHLLTRQYCPERTSHKYRPRSTNRVSRSSCTFRSQARISSIRPRTNIARRRFSSGATMGFPLCKLIKPIKFTRSRPACEVCLHQVLVSQTQSQIRTADTAVLGKADPAMGWETTGFDSSYAIAGQLGIFFPLIFGDGCLEVLDLRLTFPDKGNHGDFRDATHPEIADQLRETCQRFCTN